MRTLFVRTLFVRTLLLLLLFNTTTILTTAQDVKGSTSSNQATFADGIYNAIFSQDFEHHSAPIEYTTSKWNPDWNNPGWRDGDHRYPEWFAQNIKDSIVLDHETGSKVMKFSFTDTIVDGYAGVSPYRGGDYWKVSLGQEPKELYFSYNIKFRPGFVWNKGGKLPATNGGSPLLPATQKDCVRPGFGEGYSSAIMFKRNGTLVWYLYYQDQENDQWGENHYWEDYQPEGLNYLPDGKLSLDVSEDRWYNITMRIVVNSFSDGKPNKDGLMEGFIDGKLVSSLTGLFLLTEPDVDKGVNQIALGQFFGGNQNYQAAQRDEWTLMDDFICFTYNEGLDVPRGNNPSAPGRVLLLPNLKGQN